MRLHANVPLSTPPELRALAEDILITVALARFVSVGSLMAYGGPRGLTLEMLQGWQKAGLLHRGSVQPDPLRPQEAEYVALTTVGARELERATGRRLDGVSTARLKRSSQKRMHDVLVGEVALAAIALHADSAIELLGVETDDRKLGTVIHLAEPGKEPERIVLQPDALVVTKGPAGKEALLVEVDRGTTAPKRMETRYRGYLHWQREQGPVRDFGIRALRVVTLVPNEARLGKLHGAALRANGHRRSGFLIFALQDDLSVCTAERWLEPVAKPLGGGPDDRVRLASPTPAARAA